MTHSYIPPIPPTSIGEDHLWREWLKKVQTQINALIDISSERVTYFFSNISSDISTYKEATRLDVAATGTAGSSAVSCNTSGVLIVSFATASGFPGDITIPPGVHYCHFETVKTAGANNYYCHFKLYKRDSVGTETLLLTSDRSSETAVNTDQQVTITALSLDSIRLLATDRLVIKIYGTLLSSTATITITYGADTNARLSLPVGIYNART